MLVSSTLSLDSLSLSSPFAPGLIYAPNFTARMDRSDEDSADWIHPIGLSALLGVHQVLLADVKMSLQTKMLPN